MIFDRLIQALFRPAVRVMHGPIPTVAIYRRGEFIVVHALRQSADAITYAAPPLQRLEEPLNYAAIGAAIRAVIETKPHQWMKEPDWQAAEMLLPNALNLQNWADAMLDCVMVEVRVLRDQLTFIPTDNQERGRDDGGIVHHMDLALNGSIADTDEQLGKLAREALSLSI